MSTRHPTIGCVISHRYATAYDTLRILIETLIVALIGEKAKNGGYMSLYLSRSTSQPSPGLQKVADYFIGKSNEAKRSITNKKLQKLAYYAQAWSLALNNQEIFEEPIEAWVHGPAIRKLWSKYKNFGYQPIRVDPSIPSVDKDTSLVLSEVWRVYGHLDADYLETLTHNESPWVDARGNATDGQASSAVIELGSMTQFYRGLLSEAQQS